MSSHILWNPTGPDREKCRTGRRIKHKADCSSRDEHLRPDSLGWGFGPQYRRLQRDTTLARRRWKRWDDAAQLDQGFGWEEARSFHDPSHNHVKFTVPGLGPRVREDMPVPLEPSEKTGRIFCLNRRGKCSGAQNTVPCNFIKLPLFSASSEAPGQPCPRDRLGDIRPVSVTKHKPDNKPWPTHVASVAQLLKKAAQPSFTTIPSQCRLPSRLKRQY